MAKAAGLIVLGRLNGRNWKLEVFENRGWHWHITNGLMTVHPGSRDGTYFAMLGPDGTFGRGCWTQSSWGFKDPNRAVSFALKNAWVRVNGCMLTVIRAMKLITGRPDPPKRWWKSI